MELSAYLAAQLETLTSDGTPREEVVERVCAATGLCSEAVERAFSGDDPPDLDEVAGFARGLELDEVEALEVASGGQFHTRWFDEGEDAVSRVMAPQVATELPRGQNEFIASTGREARDGDIIDQASWRLGQYLRNPVVLDTHNAREVVGVARRTWVEGRGESGAHLRTIIEWDTDTTNPRGQLIASQHERKIRRGLSVSWITGKRVARDQLPEDDPRFMKTPRKIETPYGDFARMGVVHFNSTLLEQSSVSVPSDPRALQARGLGASAAPFVRRIRATDELAAVDLRASLRALLVDPDEDTHDAVQGIVLHLVRTSPRLRDALTGLFLSLDLPTPTPQPDGTRAEWAPYLDTLYGVHS